jgi:hypothetical protein
MKKILSTFLWAFYMIIILYVMFGVIHINELDNFIAALLFEAIGFLALGAVILGSMFSTPLKIGYLVPLIMVTVIYTLLLDVVNIVFVGIVGSAGFVLIHLVLLFFYCLISIPMYLMGRR